MTCISYIWLLYFSDKGNIIGDTLHENVYGALKSVRTLSLESMLLRQSSAGAARQAGRKCVSV